VDNINVGILGFAHGHVFAYCAKWKELPELGITVVAGWDHDDARAQQSCTNVGVPVAESAQALVARKDIDAVVIASETSFHADMVELAAAAGKAIVLQKPIALDLAQAERIVAAVKKHNVPFTMAWQMRVDPHNMKAKELLKSGEFGRVFQVRRRHCLTTQAMQNFDESWHVKAEYNHDIFADDAAHPIDFLYWLLGMPVSVVAEMGTLLNPKIANDNGIAIFRYADGTFAEASCSFVTITGENNLEIFCENGTIIGNYGDGPSCGVKRPEGGIQLKWFLKGNDGWTVSDVPDIMGQGDRIAGLAGPLSEFLHGKRAPIATAEEGLDVMKMVLACYESDEQGKRVNI